uniref:C-type lectin domain-containing protein n=1 Tax=Amphiprion percula TaxID=161767 RepID=A0A3P8TTK6_AMPPE
MGGQRLVLVTCFCLRCSGLDWYEFGDFCYKPFEEKKTWHQAQDACRKVGAELVSILSLTDLFPFPASSDVWTGLNDLITPGFFMWSDELLVPFTYWAPGEPNNHAGFSEDCVEISTNGTQSWWNDLNCDAHQDWICMICEFS